MLGRWLPLFLTALVAQPALAQNAGQLVSAETVANAPRQMQAWRVTYVTNDQDGAARTATGVIIAPRGPAPARPRRVIAWTHGAWGVAERCGPSLSADFLTQSPALDKMVARGYVVVAPDYPGLGSAGPHGFLLGKETAHSVLDAVRAAGSISEAGAGRTFAVWGESQGGHAALWTSIEARRYAPDLSLIATAAAAPPTDLPANLQSGSDANARAMLTSFALYSWSQRLQAPLSTLFRPAVRGVVARLAQNNCIELGKTPRLGTVLGVVTVRNALRGRDIMSIPPWSTIARENSVNARSVAGPLMMAQSAADAIVSPQVTRDFARRYCRLGHPLRYLSMSSTAHEHSARDSADATLDWIDARFVGDREPNDCRGI
jgi:pimeloyl-ACP methyl ester carboxylesterase